MKVTNDKKAIDPMQTAFAAFSQVRGVMRDNWENYWRTQDQILDSMEELTQGWLERRREATRTARNAACSMCDANSPVEIVQGCQTWMMGSMERVAADAAACQKHLMTVAEQLVVPRSFGGKAREAERAPVHLRASEVHARAA